MALAAASPYASFDVTAGAYEQDISPYLAEAIYFDLNFLEAVPLGWDNPVDNTVTLWNEDALNADSVTASVSMTSVATSLSVTTASGPNLHIGDLLVPQFAGSTEILQITDVPSATVATVSRAYNSTSAQATTATTVFNVIDALQEGSDIASDRSVTPVVRQNNTQIMGTRDLQVTGTQLARRMATRELQDWVGHQLANRTVELKRKLILSTVYSEPPATTSGTGSDTVYRTMQGLRSWAVSAGITNSVSTALILQGANSIATVNKSIVDRGVYPDTLIVGTGLVASIAGFDSTNRRMYESDTAAGYTVQELLLDQGNTVRVVIDARLTIGEAFLIAKERTMPRPMNGRGMFTIAATDFTDARKRRILAEWTLQQNNPESLGYLLGKT